MILLLKRSAVDFLFCFVLLLFLLFIPGLFSLWLRGMWSLFNLIYYPGPLSLAVPVLRSSGIFSWFQILLNSSCSICMRRLRPYFNILGWYFPFFFLFFFFNHSIFGPPAFKSELIEGAAENWIKGCNCITLYTYAPNQKIHSHLIHFSRGSLDALILVEW